MTVDLAEFVGDYRSEHQLPSVAWAVMRNKVIAEHGACGDGYATTTRYRIASMTKSFTAAAVLALRDEGLVDIDQPVTEVVPHLAGLRPRSDDAPPITLRLLLSMGAGMVTDDPWADRHLDMSADELDQIATDGAIFASPPGSAFQYSNLGFAIVGHVVEALTGATVQRHVVDRLLDPLGLENTGWHTPKRDWAEPFRLDDGVLSSELAPLADGVMAPMGGLWSTVGDLTKWMSWLDDAFPPRSADDSGPLRRSSRREMQAAQRWAGWRDVNGRRVPASYGFGLSVLHDERLGEVVTHAGGLPGYGSSMRWIAGRGLGVVVLSNTTYAPMTQLGALLLDQLDESMPPVTIVPPSAAQQQLAAALVDLLNAWANPSPTEAVDTTMVLADNALLDEPLERRVAEAAKLGPFEMIATERVTDAAFWVEVDTPSGRLRIDVSPAPTLPWRVERYVLTRPVEA